MRKCAVYAALMTAALFAVTPDKSYGLAALDSGAKTSCKPTAPVGSPLYRTQVNCDPADVQSFQFHFQFDSSLIELVPGDNFTTLPGYTIDSVNDDTSTALSRSSTVRPLIIK